MHAKHRKPSKTRTVARWVALTVTGGLLTTITGLALGAPAHAATRPGAATAQCWPMADRWQDGQHTAMCVPEGRGLRHWQYTLTASQAWERRMHYLECAGVGDYLIARGLVFGCEAQPVPSWWPGPDGMWTVIGTAV